MSCKPWLEKLLFKNNTLPLSLFAVKSNCYSLLSSLKSDALLLKNHYFSLLFFVIMQDGPTYWF